MTKHKYALRGENYMEDMTNIMAALNELFERVEKLENPDRND